MFVVSCISMKSKCMYITAIRSNKVKLYTDRFTKTEIMKKKHKNIMDTFKTKLIHTKNRDYYIG